MNISVRHWGGVFDKIKDEYISSIIRSQYVQTGSGKSTNEIDEVFSS